MSLNYCNIVLYAKFDESCSSISILHVPVSEMKL